MTRLCRVCITPSAGRVAITLGLLSGILTAGTGRLVADESDPAPVTVNAAAAAPAGSAASERLDPEGISGTLILCGGGQVPPDVTAFLASRMTEDQRLLIVSRAAADPSAAADYARSWLKEAGIEQVDLQSLVEDRTAEITALVAQIDAASVVWICGGQQSRLAERYAGTDVETALQRLLDRQGVVAGTSAGAAVQSRVMIASGTDVPLISTGLDLLPGAIVDQHFSQRQRITRSLVAVQEHPACWSLGIDEDTAVFVTRRRMGIVGTGNATILLAASAHQPAIEDVVHPGEVRDILQLQRAARSRASGIDPGEPRSSTPVAVEAGALVIVGGGGMPQPIVDRFLELAGGSSARIVVLPTAVPREDAFRERIPRFLSDADVEDVRILPQSRPEEIASADFQEALKSATGIWFGGGRQWNFVDAYEGTNAIELFHDVLKRGGVIGGSSAGATIQGELLVRGHPLGNTVMMAEGYERGFAFLPGTAIDQHFSQRDRWPDLIPVIRRHPKMLGIGLDESTAIVVQGAVAEVIGDHAAHFLTSDAINAAEIDVDDDPTAAEISKLYLSVPTGGSINLQTRTIRPRPAQ